MIRLRLLLLCLIVPLAALCSAPAKASASTTTTDCQEPLETEIVVAINAARAEYGLPGLHQDDILSAAAEHEEQDFTHYGYGHHVLHDGTTWGENVHNHGYSIYEWIGENITAGYAGDTAQAAVDRWMNSPSHRGNILNPKYTAIGVGHGKWVSGNPDPYVHYWVSDFGSLNEATADLC